MTCNGYKARRPIDDWLKYEQSVTERALALCRDQPSSYNIAPLMDLIRRADAIGYAVVRKPDTEGDGK